jgi:hypothetical protein
MIGARALNFCWTDARVSGVITVPVQEARSESTTSCYVASYVGEEAAHRGKQVLGDVTSPFFRCYPTGPA